MIPLVRVNCSRCGNNDAVSIVKTPDYEMNWDVKFEVSQCRHCGLAYTSIRPESEVLYSKLYPDDYLCYGVKTGSWIADFVNEKRVLGQIIQRSRLLLKHIQLKEGIRMLDVGCATGKFLMYFKDKFKFEVYGVEPNAQLCNILKKKGVNIINSTIEDAELPNNYYDIICMFHVLEHVWDPILTLKKLNTFLKDNGVLLIELPNFDATARKVFGKYWFNYHQPRHLTHFTKKIIENIIPECGFDMIEFKYEFRPTINAFSIQYAVHDFTRSKILKKIVSHKNPLLILIGIVFEAIFNIFGKSNTITVILKKKGEISTPLHSLLKSRRIDCVGDV
jgi:ubiquinone/menaquinone biosynthesis C-methylase UbiE